MTIFFNIIIGILIGIAFLLMIEYPSCLLSKFSSGFGISNEKTEKYQTLQVLGWVMGGLIVLKQAMASEKRAEAMNDTAKAQKDTAKAHMDSNRQTTFKDAIVNLGHESSSVRLGGIYALHGLANKWLEEYCKTVFKILNAHVRDSTKKKEYKENNKDKPSNEIQSIIDLLTKEENNSKYLEYELKVNFNNAFLNGADFRKAQLQKANLSSAQLQGANLQFAKLQAANLSSAQLQGANLQFAKLQAANLQSAQLQEAKLANAQLQFSILFNARLQLAELINIQLQAADLQFAELQAANLLGAELQAATFQKTNFQGVTDQIGNNKEGGFKQKMLFMVNHDSDMNHIIYRGLCEKQYKKIFSLFKELRIDDSHKHKLEELEQQSGKNEEFFETNQIDGIITGKLQESEAIRIIKDYENS